MQIKPAQVKELRERTGAGMMDCKKALVDAAGDLDAAAEILRKAGQAKADKKASRVAAEGKILVASDAGAGRHAIAEVNSETDFVAKDENFAVFADRVCAALLEHEPADVDALMQLDVGGETLEEARKALVAKVGENITVRRFDVLVSPANVASYVHMGRIGVLVELTGGTPELARDLAMQVAATAPRYLSAEDVPEAELAKEREILSAQAAQEGKPEHILEKMVEGRLRKHLDQITLLGQAFVKDPDKTVRELLKEHAAEVKRFLRYEVGEGIDKQAKDFGEEVAALL
jgi:elongation factor Ts